MLDLNILAGFSIILVTGVFIVWFFGKLTHSVTTK